MRRLRLREVRRLEAEVAQQPAQREREHGSDCSEERELVRVRGAVLPGEHDQERERDHHHGDPAVEPAGLGVRPRVERPHDLAAAVGVRAALLAGQALQTCARAR